MKAQYLFILCIFILEGACKCQNCLEYDTSIYIDNNSEFTISFYIPLIGMNGGIYPDTTITFDKKNVGYPTKSGDIAHAGISNISLERWVQSFPNDTVSIYIFDKEILDSFLWEIIQQDYNILQRYDLSLEDFYTLYNKSKIPVITYPPTEAMKDMKMYPPYELHKGHTFETFYPRRRR